ncbi:MAG: 4'-phosphopantetheinyl transferase superfamily protein [Kineosporiaceae bacterium]|nr:4'-phosphopantetheinyl transferase superfamily protein [Kineosporiaceae bacterium]
MSPAPGMLVVMRWLARGERELPEQLDWLLPAERARLDMLRYTKRRTEYLLRRWTAKHAAAGALGWLGEDGTVPVDHLARVLVGNHPTGAPYVEVDGAPLGSDISVSDRAGWAVSMVGSQGMQAVGIDLEIVEPRTEGFVDDFLTGPEREVVRALPDRTDRDGAANLIWSAKEAALKVLRTGLRADTRTVEVSVPEGFSRPARTDGWSPLAVRHAPSGRVFTGWWRRDGVFLLSLVAESGLAEPPTVLPGSSALADAVPTHSWLANPLAW